MSKTSSNFQSGTGSVGVRTSSTKRSRVELREPGPVKKVAKVSSAVQNAATKAVKDYIAKNVETKWTIARMGCTATQINAEALYHGIPHANQQMKNILDPVTGPTEGTRIGNQVVAKRMWIRGHLQNTADRPVVQYRLVVVHTPVTAASPPEFNEDYPYGEGCGNAFFNGILARGCTVLYNKVVTVSGSGQLAKNKPAATYPTSFDLGNTSARVTYDINVKIPSRLQKVMFRRDTNYVAHTGTFQFWIVPFDSYQTLGSDQVGSGHAVIKMYYTDS